MNVIEISNLTKTFENKIALNNVSISIQAGEVCGILGPNGAGKTTLIRILNGLLTKDSGNISIIGKVLNLDGYIQLGYLPEERGLYLDMTVKDQILYFSQLRGASKSETLNYIEKYIYLFDAEEIMNFQIKELSKGNQQKIQILSAIAHNPQIIIFDEPLSGFDPFNNNIFLHLIKELRDEGKTILICSHNLHAVEQMCDTVIMINDGKVLTHSNISDLKKNYFRNKYEVVTSSALPIDCEKFHDFEPIHDCSLDSFASEDFKYVVTLGHESTNLEILNKIGDYSDVVAFYPIIPSLNEIFIEVVRNDLSINK